MDLNLTVIIPTYNRKEILRKCLEALFNQKYTQSEYEIIIVDDGSTDGTKNFVELTMKNSLCKIRYFNQVNKGPAAARNIGIRNADGKILLFIGDDIIADENLLNEHYKWHMKFSEDNIGVLGYITWSKEIEITPFMRWLENGGPQFCYWKIGDKIDVDPQNYFYSSNISFKKNFLIKNNEFFDEDFPYAAFEDNEFGYRLKKRGLILKYNKLAIGYHYHYTSLEDACKRMIKIGESYQILMSKLSQKEKTCSILAMLRSIARYIRAKISYPVAKFYEKRAIKSKIFYNVLEYWRHFGIEQYNKKKAQKTKLMK